LYTSASLDPLREYPVYLLVEGLGVERRCPVGYVPTWFFHVPVVWF
jgi:hypothetical protein